MNQKKKRNKSTTKRPISQDDRCSFNLRVFCWDDNSWYLRPLACHDQPFHCKHVKLSHTKIPASLIPEETRTLIQDATISLVDTSAVRRMVLNRYDLHVSNEQIRTIRKKTIEELIEEAGLKPYGSSAEKLINLFSSFDDVNFMYLLHTQESGFVKIKCVISLSNLRDYVEKVKGTLLGLAESVNNIIDSVCAHGDCTFAYNFRYTTDFGF